MKTLTLTNEEAERIVRLAVARIIVCDETLSSKRFNLSPKNRRGWERDRAVVRKILSRLVDDVDGLVAQRKAEREQTLRENSEKQRRGVAIALQGFRRQMGKHL